MEPYHNGYYLIQAFNSSRFLTLCEKIFFSAPYDNGLLKVVLPPPSSMELHISGTVAFRSAMAEHSCVRSIVHEDWNGPVFLPGASFSKQRYFFVHLEGETQHFPFSPDIDYLSIAKVKDYPVFEWLLLSRFNVLEWRLRNNAIHRKSRTITRHL